jgi:hypothetical protein
MIPWIFWCLLFFFPFFLSDFTDLGFFSPHFRQICQGLVNFFLFFKKSAFCFFKSLFGVFGLHSLILALIFIISLLLLVLVLLVLVFLGL